MKKLLKKIGRIFVVLSRKYEKDLRQSILLVDGGFILPNNFALIIKGVRKRFTNANLTVLTFQDKKEFVKDNFPDVEVIVPGDRVKLKRYQLATQLLFLLRRGFDFVILSSLDISVASISLIFAGCPIFLHNRWMGWFRIRQRTLSDILRGVRGTDRNRRRRNNGIKDVIKSAGRIFVILRDIKEEDINNRILIVDNGYTGIGHVLTAVKRAEEIFINPDITVLTFAQRKQDFINNFPNLKIAEIKESKNRYRLAKQMYRLRKHKFNCVILTTLDISPIVVSFLFIRRRVLLYNRWHQWWSLDFGNMGGYFKRVLALLVMIPVFIYLLIAAGLILFRTNFKLALMKLKPIVEKRNENRYKTV